MNQAHYHLALNHLPIIIPMIGLLVLIGGFLTRSETVRRTAFLIFILGALATIPSIGTGDGAEEAIENINGISKVSIHEHEEMAETFALLSYILGIAALTAFLLGWKKSRFARYAAYALIAYSAVVIYFAVQTGNSGGRIRHPEIITDTKP
ncbi:hypothetical protein [uncultured Flavobacterium sp.]|uniref:hypothetical protein n=1 Tax=uncultured Flavobacterium sp. TaxID=165435 RepID=UPI0025D03551|nr:hypothetical protein [uncultured Flavobacterium sp.]